MKLSYEFDYLLFGQVMELVHLDPYYINVTTGSHTNSVYLAIKHNKCIPHYKDGALLGFCTYGFFTEEELNTRTWDGDTVYAREHGGSIYFPKFQCRAGRKEVTTFIRNIQLYMSQKYPEIDTAVGLRVYPEGATRKEKWYRKSA